MYGFSGVSWNSFLDCIVYSYGRVGLQEQHSYGNGLSHIDQLISYASDMLGHAGSVNSFTPQCSN